MATIRHLTASPLVVRHGQRRGSRVLIARDKSGDTGTKLGTLSRCGSVYSVVVTKLIFITGRRNLSDTQIPCRFALIRVSQIRIADLFSTGYRRCLPNSTTTLIKVSLSTYQEILNDRFTTCAYHSVPLPYQSPSTQCTTTHFSTAYSCAYNKISLRLSDPYHESSSIAYHLSLPYSIHCAYHSLPIEHTSTNPLTTAYHLCLS